MLLAQRDVLQLRLEKFKFSTESDAKEWPEWPANDGAFHWTNLPTRFPVTNFAPVPQPQSRSLPAVQVAHVNESQQLSEQRERRRADVKRAFQRC